jgi:hypothetical protein
MCPITSAIERALLNKIKSRDRVFGHNSLYWGADKSLARPGRKQATATEDFDVHVSYLLS